MPKTPKRIEISEAWGLSQGWMMHARNEEGLDRVIDSGERQYLVRRAQRMAMEERSIILVFDACRTVVEAYESIDCRQAVEDGIQARGVITENGHIRHVVVPIDPDSVRF